LHCVALARLDEFAEDAPGILDGALKRLLIGDTHKGTSNNDDFVVRYPATVA
jgi:hypothetical protein